MPRCAKSGLVDVVPAEMEKAVVTGQARPLWCRHWARGDGSVDAQSKRGFSEEGARGRLGWEGTTR